MSEAQPVEGGLEEPEELEPDQGTLALADPGDTHTRADWERAAAAVLRKVGRLRDDQPDDAVWDALTLTTLDGLEVPPLGTPDLLDGLATAGRPARAGGWEVRTRAADREQALVDLDAGATSLWVAADADLPALLDGVMLDLAPVVLDGATAAQARSFLDLLGDTTPADGTNLGADAAGDDVVEVARLARDAGVLAAVVDGSALHEQGASDVQELGHLLATAAAYLRRLTGEGLTVEQAAGLVEFRLTVTDHQFPTIAKLRAARRLWARMLELSGAEPVTMRIHAVTSRPMMSPHDPWVNMLRTTVAAFAAGVGGADAVTVVPFDSPLGEPDEFGRRIARNTSHLLLAESHLGRVADPAGGAYAVEKLTDDLALAAWEELGRIEAAGADAFEARVAETVAARDRAVATREQPITGLSEFPHLGEALPSREGPGDGVRRWGAAFEELRDTPADTPVHLVTLGSVAAHTARATWTTNLFAAGGIAVTTEPSGPAPVACVVGTDAAYDEEGAARAAALREAGASWVIVAGRPREWADDSCAAGLDAIDFLRRTKEALS